MNYLNRDYKYGVTDCFSLVKDYYKHEFNIELEDYERIDIPYWYRTGRNFCEEGCLKNDFNILVDSQFEIGDILLMQMVAHVPNHLAVYVGESNILHQLRTSPSTIELYSDYWASKVKRHLRHKSKL